MKLEASIKLQKKPYQRDKIINQKGSRETHIVMNLSRKEILKGDYTYPSDLVKLRFTNHFRNRLEERQLGLDCIPKLVRVTKDNIYSAKTVDNKTLSSVVVRLNYTSSRYLLIAFNPNDGAAKSMWFLDKHGRRNREGNKQAV